MSDQTPNSALTKRLIADGLRNNPRPLAEMSDEELARVLMNVSVEMANRLLDRRG